MSQGLYPLWPSVSTGKSSSAKLWTGGAMAHQSSWTALVHKYGTRIQLLLSLCVPWTITPGRSTCPATVFNLYVMF